MNGIRKFSFCGIFLQVLLVYLLSVSAVTGKQPGGDFVLTDHNGQRFELKQLRGKVVLLFFGYTTCPDVCPAALGELAMVFNRMGDKAEKVQGLFVSVDPERDTADVLKQYVAYFSSNIIGLTGSVDELDAVASQYHATYHLNKQEGKSYSVDHVANLYIIGPDGTLQAVVPYGFPAQHVQSIVNQLVKTGSLEK